MRSTQCLDPILEGDTHQARITIDLNDADPVDRHAYAKKNACRGIKLAGIYCLMGADLTVSHAYITDQATVPFARKYYPFLHDEPESEATTIRVEVGFLTISFGPETELCFDRAPLFQRLIYVPTINGQITVKTIFVKILISSHVSPLSLSLKIKSPNQTDSPSGGNTEVQPMGDTFPVPVSGF